RFAVDVVVGSGRDHAHASSGLSAGGRERSVSGHRYLLRLPRSLRQTLPATPLIWSVIVGAATECRPYNSPKHFITGESRTGEFRGGRYSTPPSATTSNLLVS